MGCYLIRYGSGNGVVLQQISRFFASLFYKHFAYYPTIVWQHVGCREFVTIDPSPFCVAFKLFFVWSLI
jgi:hypothetical protein